MNVAASNRDALTTVHVAWFSNPVRRLKRNDFRAVVVDLDEPDEKGLEALLALKGITPRLRILVFGNDTLLEHMKIVEHRAGDHPLQHLFDADTLTRALRGSVDYRRAPLTKNSTKGGVLSIDNSRVITFHTSAEGLLGLMCAHAAGRHLLDVIHVVEATTRKRVLPRMQSKQRGGSLPPNSLLVRRDCHESPIEDHAAPTYIRSNHVSGIVMVSHEVTGSHAIRHNLGYPAKHEIVVTRPNNRLMQATAGAPALSEPVDSGELLSLGQQRWVGDSPFPRRACLITRSRGYQRTDSSMMTDQLIGNGRRWGQRIELDIPVRVAAHASPTIHGRLKNLSLSGALIEADHKLRPLTYIEVSIKLPDAGRRARVMARVTREVGGAVGLEWCEFAPSAIKDLLKSHSVRLPV
jgi:hypothetical protein